MNKNTRLIVIVFSIWVLTAVAFGQANQWGPYDPGAARNDLSNVTPATGRAALELGTMAVATATDYVATSSLAARVDTINASFTGSIDVTGDVGAATINGVAPLTAGEKTQALVGSSTVNFSALSINSYFSDRYKFSAAAAATYTVAVFDLDSNHNSMAYSADVSLTRFAGNGAALYHVDYAAYNNAGTITEAKSMTVTTVSTLYGSPAAPIFTATVASTVITITVQIPEVYTGITLRQQATSGGADPKPVTWY